MPGRVIRARWPPGVRGMDRGVPQPPHDTVEEGPRSPMAEAGDLKSLQCGFESHRGYETVRAAWIDVDSIQIPWES